MRVVGNPVIKEKCFEIKQILLFKRLLVRVSTAFPWINPCVDFLKNMLWLGSFILFLR